MWWFVGGLPVGWSAGRLAVGLWPLYRAVTVTEALEVVVRAGLGAQNPGAVSVPLKVLKRRRSVAA